MTDLTNDLPDGEHFDGRLRDAIQAVIDEPIAVEEVRKCIDQTVDKIRARGAPSPTPKLGRWFTTAAAIVIVVLVATWWFSRPDPLWSQIIDAVRQHRWIHGQSTGDRVCEVWLSPTMQVACFKDSNAIRFSDLKLGLRYRYVTKENRLYRNQLGQANLETELAQFNWLIKTFLGSDDPESPPFMQAEIKEEHRREVTDQQGTWTQFDFMLQQINSDQRSRVSILVDPKSKLPKSMTLTFSGAQQNDQPSTTKFVFDYPEQGPTDIYMAGAPRTAEFVDQVPTGDLDTVLRHVQVNRERLPTQYQLLAVEGYDGVELWQIPSITRLSRKGRQWRLDQGGPSKTWTKPDPPSAEQDSAEQDMHQWWKRRIDDGHYDFFPQFVCDGKAVYKPDNLQPGVPWNPKAPAKWKRYTDSNAGIGLIHHKLPFQYCYPVNLMPPNENISLQLDKNPGDQHAGSWVVNTMVTQGPDEFPSRYFIDPNRGFVTTRIEHLKLDAKDDANRRRPTIYVNEQFVQSPTGVWYPTVVRWKNSHDIDGDGSLAGDRVTWFFVDFDIQLDDDFFNPSKIKRD